MTAAVTVGAHGNTQGNAPVAAASVAAAVVLLAVQERFRRVEASTCASLLRLLHIAPADSLGTAVTFPARDRFVGFTVAPGCTAALLIAPFLVVTGVLLFAGRVPPRRALATVSAFAAVVAMVNQLRLLVISISMRHWGYPDGFERSHLLLGSVVSTIGVAGGLLLFLRMVVPRQERTGRR